MIKKLMLLSAITMVALTKISAQGEAEMKAWMAYMTPGEMHKMLAKCDGTWECAVKMWMAPEAPPTESKSIATNTMICGGRYQESINKGDMMGMPFEGRSIIGFDNNKKVFTSTWVDNFGTGTMVLTGTYDAKTKTITLIGTMPDPMSGKDVAVRETFAFIDDNTQVIEMFANQGGKEFKTMHIDCKRKK